MLEMYEEEIVKTIQQLATEAMTKTKKYEDVNRPIEIRLNTRPLSADETKELAKDVCLSCYCDMEPEVEQEEGYSRHLWVGRITITKWVGPKDGHLDAEYDVEAGVVVMRGTLVYRYTYSSGYEGCKDISEDEYYEISSDLERDCPYRDYWEENGGLY